MSRTDFSSQQQSLDWQVGWLDEELHSRSIELAVVQLIGGGKEGGKGEGGSSS